MKMVATIPSLPTVPTTVFRRTRSKLTSRWTFVPPQTSLERIGSSKLLSRGRKWIKSPSTSKLQADAKPNSVFNSRGSEIGLHHKGSTRLVIRRCHRTCTSKPLFKARFLLQRVYGSKTNGMGRKSVYFQVTIIFLQPMPQNQVQVPLSRKETRQSRLGHSSGQQVNRTCGQIVEKFSEYFKTAFEEMCRQKHLSLHREEKYKKFFMLSSINASQANTDSFSLSRHKLAAKYFGRDVEQLSLKEYIALDKDYKSVAQSTSTISRQVNRYIKYDKFREELSKAQDFNDALTENRLFFPRINLSEKYDDLFHNTHKISRNSAGSLANTPDAILFQRLMGEKPAHWVFSIDKNRKIGVAELLSYGANNFCKIKCTPNEYRLGNRSVDFKSMEEPIVTSEQVKALSP
ncbi:hypothetical protein ACTFIR_007528 [Dictyostelium discoideum]